LNVPPFPNNMPVTILLLSFFAANHKFVRLAKTNPLCNYSEKSILFSKTFRLRVCSICQSLLLWPGAVRSLQFGLWSI